MAWFEHMCNYCGLRHKDLFRWEGRYQCEDRSACVDRRAALTFDQRIRLDVLGERP